jgi:hypothetical protein
VNAIGDQALRSGKDAGDNLGKRKAQVDADAHPRAAGSNSGSLGGGVFRILRVVEECFGFHKVGLPVRRMLAISRCVTAVTGQQL